MLLCPCGITCDNEPRHCSSNAMFSAPNGNPYGAKFYGAAAVSPSLVGNGWLPEVCGTCFKVTGRSITGVTSTLVLKATNVCPAGNPLCAAGDHFDAAAPGFGKFLLVDHQSVVTLTC